MRMSLRGWGPVLMMAVSVVLLNAGPTLAHAVYESSDPPDGGTVSSPPSQVSAEFSEALIPDNSYMDVTDPCGTDVGGVTTVAASNMTVTMSGTHAGTYVVAWKAHSSVDGHVTTGSFSFSSTGGDPCPGEEPEDGGGGNGSAPRSGGGGGNAAGGESSAASGGSGAEVSDDGGTSQGGAASVGQDSTKSQRSRGDEKGTKKAERDRNTDPEPASLVQAGPQSDVPDLPSALEGISLGGLLVTLAVAALIGAAGGKIYFSLSGEGS